MASVFITSPLYRAMTSAIFPLSIATLAACSGASSTAPALPSDPFSQSRDAATGAYKSLYFFKGGADSANPFAGLTEVNGSLYGVTYGNKVGSCSSGSVFTVSPSGKERVLYCFKGTPDGAEPVGSLTAVNGVLYGSTFNGGTHGLGSVFAISTAGKEHVIYSFAGGTDGTNPGAGLVVLQGELYGTTIDSGGAETGNGTVFKVSTSGDERVLYHFKGRPSDGSSPYSSLIAVKGELYGTTQGGGTNGDGTIYEIGTSGGERVLYSFLGPPDGAFPTGDLTFFGGSLYGTTPSSPGTIFESSLSGKEHVIYTFKGAPADGSGPRAGLTVSGGVLYGTTEFGGRQSFGAIFETTASGKERMLYSFKGSPKDGANPFGDLIALKGILYGTTVNGGIDVGGQNHPDAGSIFSFTP